MIEAAPRRFHPLVLIPFLITLVWALMVIIAPLTLPAGSVKDLSGVVGLRDNENQTRDMNPFARWVYDSGDVNCHQRADRSLSINGNEMPYCARCVGIFAGLVIGAMLSLYIILDLKVWYILAALVPMAIDGGMQALGFWESTNPVRLMTGGLAGFITGIALGYIFFVIEQVIADRRRSKAAASVAGGGRGIGSLAGNPGGAGGGSGGGLGGGTAPGPQNAKDEVQGEDGRKDG